MCFSWNRVSRICLVHDAVVPLRGPAAIAPCSLALERNVVVLEDSGADNSTFLTLIGLQRLRNSFISTQLCSSNLEIACVPQEHLRQLSSQGKGFSFWCASPVAAFVKKQYRVSLELHL